MKLSLPSIVVSTFARKLNVSRSAVLLRSAPLLFVIVIVTAPEAGSVTGVPRLKVEVRSPKTRPVKSELSMAVPLAESRVIVMLRPTGSPAPSRETLKLAFVPSVTAEFGPLNLIVTGGTLVMAVETCWVAALSEPKSLSVTWKDSVVSVFRSAFTGTASVAIELPAPRLLVAVATPLIRPVVLSTLMFFSTIPAAPCSELTVNAARSVKMFAGLLPWPLSWREKATLSPTVRPAPPFRLMM